MNLLSTSSTAGGLGFTLIQNMSWIRSRLKKDASVRHAVTTVGRISDIC